MSARSRSERPPFPAIPEHARFGDAATHAVAERLQALGDDARRAHFLEAELGMSVEIAPELNELARFLLDGFHHARHRGSPSGWSVRRFGRTLRPAVDDEELGSWDIERGIHDRQRDAPISERRGAGDAPHGGAVVLQSRAGGRLAGPLRLRCGRAIASRASDDTGARSPLVRRSSPW